METEKKTKGGRGARSVPAAVLLALAGLLLLLAVLLAVDGRHVRFYLTDGEEITVPRGQAFEEPGVRAFSVGRLTGESAEELPVYVEGEVDTETVGTYELRYTARTMFRRFSVTRLVRVEDRTPPEITLFCREGYMPSWLEGYVEEGFAAWDDLDGDLTDRVEVEQSGDIRVYTVTDAAGNRTRVERRIPYSIGRPEICLNGGETLEIDASFAFADPGFSCTDARGNDLSALVIREGAVIPYAAGEYELRYCLENALGERAEATRRVIVRPLRNPEPGDAGGKVIYLTFDDGPGPFTDGLLDVLSLYNVKATFFVTGLDPAYADCIGRAWREGHSIGVHSASHNYRQIYASEEAFLADFEAMQAIIREQTGQESTIFRFPGGSSNTVSRFNRGIMTRLAGMMTERGYRYFDWNVSAGDAGDMGENYSAEQVLQNIIDGCSQRNVSVVLQHDSLDFSVAAVERVIIWGLTNGYRFAPLDETSEPVRHRIAN